MRKQVYLHKDLYITLTRELFELHNNNNNSRTRSVRVLLKRTSFQLRMDTYEISRDF